MRTKNVGEPASSVGPPSAAQKLVKNDCILWWTCLCPNYSPDDEGREGGGDDVVGHAEDVGCFDIHAGL